MTPTETPSVEAAIDAVVEHVRMQFRGVHLDREKLQAIATAARQERSMVAAKRGIANEKLRAKVQDQAAELELWKDRAALTKVDSHPVGEAQSTEKP